MFQHPVKLLLISNLILRWCCLHILKFSLACMFPKCWGCRWADLIGILCFIQESLKAEQCQWVGICPVPCLSWTRCCFWCDFHWSYPRVFSNAVNLPVIQHYSKQVWQVFFQIILWIDYSHFHIRNFLYFCAFLNWNACGKKAMSVVVNIIKCLSSPSL